MKSDDIPLHDIKPLVEIQDYTVYFLGGAFAVVTFLLLAIVFIVWKQWRLRRLHDRRRRCFAELEAVDFSDAKAAAYAISRLGRCFRDDSPRLLEAYRNLEERLEPYKYRREVPPIDGETRSYYRIFLGMIDV
jgi:hypothetical protein